MGALTEFSLLKCKHISLQDKITDSVSVSKIICIIFLPKDNNIDMSDKLSICLILGLKVNMF